MNHEEASTGLAVLGGREGAFAEQADIRKKVLWGQWEECALAGAHNRHGWEMLRANGGDDERATAIVADSEQRSG